MRLCTTTKSKDIIEKCKHKIKKILINMETGDKVKELGVSIKYMISISHQLGWAWWSDNNISTSKTDILLSAIVICNTVYIKLNFCTIKLMQNS